jgi:hypothetical protein|tara:strand:- start:864 stop:1241 length:378 start_codon:yes stop_codon:yes gene_type:complete
MESWLLHILVFIFGYITCKTFYFLRANRLSLMLIKLSHVIYLSATVKAIESLITARDTIKFNNIEPTKEEEVFETEIKLLKDNSMAYLLQLHPRFYRDALKFNDWESSMLYLNNNKDEAFKMWKK